MNRCLKYTLVIGMVLIAGGVRAAGIPVTDPSQLITIIEDQLDNGVAEKVETYHDTVQGYKNDVVGVQSAVTKLTQKNGLQKALLGKSNMLSKGFKSLGIDFSDPTKAMSNDTLKKLRSELVLPSTEEELKEMTEEQIQKIALTKAQEFQAMSIRSLAEAWVAQTEASAKAELLTNLGKEAEKAETQTDIFVALVRLSAETSAELQARNMVTAGNLKDQSIVVLQDSK